MAGLDPELKSLGRLLRTTEILHLHLLELPRPEYKLTRGDLVPEALPHLSDTERQLPARGATDVVEVDEDSLCGLGSEIDEVVVVFHRTGVRAEHEVERLRLGEAIRRTTVRARVGILQLVDTESLVAVPTLNQGISENCLMARCLPHLARLQDGGVKADDVVSFLNHRSPPLVFDISQELNSEGAVVVSGTDPPVNLRRLENEAALLGQRGDGLKGYRHRNGEG